MGSDSKSAPHVYDANLSLDADLQSFFESDSLVIATRFFRNAELFAQLEQKVIPQILENGVAKSGELRIWSAGCSDGRETYSLLMASLKVLDDLGHSNIKVVARGSDLNRETVHKARLGNYGLTKGDDRLLSRYESYFDRIGSARLEIKPDIRAQAQFVVEDISEDDPGQLFDIIICSLVVLYYNPDVQKVIVKKLLQSLQSNGCFFIAPAGGKWLRTEGYSKVDNIGPFYRAIPNG